MIAGAAVSKGRQTVAELRWWAARVTASAAAAPLTPWDEGLVTLLRRAAADYEATLDAVEGGTLARSGHA